MRRAAAFLALLLCLYWTRAQGESGGTSDQTNISPDIWAELKELRDMAIQHSVELTNSKSKMEKLEQENTAIQVRLTISEYKNAVLENVDKELLREYAVLEARMNARENEVEELKTQNADQPKVAFSLGLTDSGRIGPFNTDITLKFSKVITNFGHVYSPVTGLFTAPVRGAYYFSFNILDDRGSAFRNVYLYHNDKKVMDSYNYSTNSNESVSNSLVLQLEKGDVVYLVLPASETVYDDANDHTFFNGFLLFPL